MPVPPIGGAVDPAFAAVRDAFVENFRPTDADPGDLGAAVAVYCDGMSVVDLWGGWREPDGQLPWEHDTLVNAYSIGKAVAAVTVLALVDDGLLDLDAPLEKAWPAFGQHGKGAVTLRWALSHRAAVPAVREVLGEEAMFDWKTMVDALARTPPWWEPGIEHGYHANTYGFLVGEPARRASGQRFGEVLAERVTRPLDLDFHIGLSRREHRRVATIDLPSPGPTDAAPRFPDDPDVVMRLHTYFNPSGLSGMGVVNTPEWRLAEIPSTNSHATARAVARLYAALAAGGELDGVGVVSESLVDDSRREHAAGPDRVLERDSRFGLGFMLDQPGRPVGIGPESFGHYGFGGSLGFADRGAAIGFGYVINRPGDRWQVPRTKRLLAALRECLA